MVTLVETLRIAGASLGAIGGVLLFIEFFQLPSYVSYDTDFQSYSVEISPNEADAHTWFGRIGALLIASGFGLQLAATFLS